MAVFRDLVRASDVVMENFTPRVMRGFGLDYESLREVRPDLVMLSSTGYGHTGPWASFTAVGPTTEAASGLAAVPATATARRTCRTSPTPTTSRPRPACSPS
ncbi:MAG: CoA transferase [Dehalococcoidia bacterium]